jgi:hypothetical protein
MRILYFLAVAWASLQGTVAAFAAEPVDFATEILPLLSDRCSLCHGPDEESREAELRLDSREAVGAETQNGGHDLVIVPGDASASELIRRISSNEVGEQMPPPDSNLSLSADEIAILKRWIDEGAKWDTHWSFRKLSRPVPPDTSQGNASGEVDRFIDAKLAEKNLTANLPADRRTLVRRVALDLTGLPPSIEIVDQFLHDNRPDAYTNLVDRLLASPAFGERIAVPWLDAARYADTYGYQSDVYREVWPWRDWVIQAFQQNMPYDQFITWQLAGDLLPNPTRDSQLATAFNRLHRQTNEGGSVEEEFRAEYISDRVNTLGTSILGLTLECARCHDHKYDPISQKEYYQLAAFFTNIDESGLYSHFTNFVPTPALDLPNEAQQQQMAAARQAVSDAEATYRQAIETVTAQGPKPNDTLADELAFYDFGSDPDTIATTNGIESGPELKKIGAPKTVPGPIGTAMELDGENGFSTPVGGDWDWYQPFSIAAWIRPSMHHDRAVVWHRSRAWTDAASCGYELLIEDGKLSTALIHFWPGDAVRVQAVDALPLNEWSHVCITSDGSGRAAGLKIYVGGVPIQTDIIRDRLRRTIRGGGANELAIGNRFRDRGFKLGQLDQLRIFSRDLAPTEVPLLASLAEQTPPASQEAVVAIDEQVRNAKQVLFEARKKMASIQDSIASIMTMRETPGLHEARILRRGQYDQPGDEVLPLLPTEISPMVSASNATDSPSSTTDAGSSTRLDLARWLTDSRPDHRHPLVARVAVNRIWQLFFDRGIVATPEDFGLQGQPPSHPELLDFLAASLIEEQWDLKRLVRRIVTSNAYKRSSTANTKLIATDPENMWIARGPSSRLPIETIRDSALSTSGLLDRSIGGPPVKPYQPSGLWAEKSGGVYQRQSGASSQRRSLYTIWKRTSPPPSMLIFDAPGREVCTAARTITHTPLQSLVLLNDEQFVEAARGTAFQILTSASESIEDRINELFQRILQRPANDAERQVVADLIEGQIDYFSQSADQANLFLSIGDFDYTKTHAASKLNPAELAAWTVAAQTIMNLDEWVTR